MRLSRNPKRLLLILISILGMGIFLSLGNWQLNQAERKRVLLDSHIARKNQQPVIINSRDTLATLPVYTPVTLSGHWLSDQTILLDNQRRQGQTGVLVLTPLVLHSGEAVLVNRGFVPLTIDRKLAAEQVTAIKFMPATDAANVIHGFYWTWPRVGLDMSPVLTLLEGFSLWSNLVPAQVVASKPQLSLHAEGVILLGESLGSFPRDFQPINQGFGPEKHIAYAVQWFSFAGIIVILWLAFFWRRRPRAL